MQSYEKKRIVRPGEDVVAAIAGFPSRRLVSGGTCRIRNRRHIVGYVRRTADATGLGASRTNPELGRHRLLLWRLVVSSGHCGGGSHEPAVDCKARHGRISEKERLSRSRSETMPVLRTILLSGCSADAANGLFYGIPLPGDAVRFLRTVRRKIALACERWMLGLCVPVPLAFVPSAGYRPAMKSRMARSCASMLCKSRN